MDDNQIVDIVRIAGYLSPEQERILRKALITRPLPPVESEE